MEDFVIRAEGVSKQFRIGGLNSSNSLRGYLENLLRSPIRAVRRADRVYSEQVDKAGHFWALHDVSFAIRPGEIVGLMGHNGAGKSVLLKILSRVTLPTEGHAMIRGRVNAMLEAGVGFHPELTGRENILLSGAIQRKKWAYINRQLDAITAFSGVETFLDTPIKRYSSGMRIRLGFAIAFHMAPQILIIDEAFTVEDSEFGARCQAKIQEMAQDGTTILIVSHNPEPIRAMCSRAMLLDHGHLIFDGAPGATLAEYHSHAR